MRKFAVFSGFLGSGKTTTMMALTSSNKAAMITNDLGGPGLADDRFAKLRGARATEITNDCICYKNEELMDTLNRLFDEGYYTTKCVFFCKYFSRIYTELANIF